MLGSRQAEAQLHTAALLTWHLDSHNYTNNSWVQLWQGIKCLCGGRWWWNNDVQKSHNMQSNIKQRNNIIQTETEQKHAKSKSFPWHMNSSLILPALLTHLHRGLIATSTSMVHI